MAAQAFEGAPLRRPHGTRLWASITTVPTLSPGAFKAAPIPAQGSRRKHPSAANRPKTKKPAATTGVTAGSIVCEVPFQA